MASRTGRAAANAPAWLGLAEQCLAAGRWHALDQIVIELETRCNRRTEAAMVRARAQLAKREFQQAKQTLGEIIAAEPKSLRPRLILSHVLLQEGIELEAAERVLLQIPQMRPDHVEARQNLALLREQKSRAKAV